MTDFSADRPAANDTPPFTPLAPLDDDGPASGDDREQSRRKGNDESFDSPDGRTSPAGPTSPNPGAGLGGSPSNLGSASGQPSSPASAGSGPNTGSVPAIVPTAGGPGPTGSFAPRPATPTGSTESFAPTATGAPGTIGSFESPPPMQPSTPSFAPTSPQVPTTPSSPPSGPRGATPPSAPNGAQRMPEVKGRIEVADEVVEKVAGLAAMEVEGVADLGGDIARALESVRERIGIGQKRGDQGIKARISGREVAIDVVIMIEYGYVVMDVARAVKHNVATQANRMLGLRVVEVNVTVDDVRMPKPPPQPEEEPPEDLYNIPG